MKKSLKWLFLLSIILIASVLLAACGPSPDLSGAAGGSDCSHENTDGDNEY